MKTHVIPLYRDCLARHGESIRRSWRIASPTRSLLAVLAAALPAAAIAVVAVLGFSAAAPGLAAASLWVSGFAFFALAIESSGRTAQLLAASATMLLLFAWLSTEAAPEFGVLGGFILAAWVAVTIIGRFLRPEEWTPETHNGAASR